MSMETTQRIFMIEKEEGCLQGLVSTYLQLATVFTMSGAVHHNKTFTLTLDKHLSRIKETL